MAGLPKRYAKMGFKAGWKAFKSDSRKTTTIKTSKRSNMAKKRKIKRYSSKTGGQVKLIQPSAMVYGAVRGKVSDMISPMLAKVLPMGNALDEVSMGIVDYFVAKKSSGMIRDIALDGLKIENAMLGSEIVRGGFSAITGVVNSNKSTGGYPV